MQKTPRHRNRIIGLTQQAHREARVGYIYRIGYMGV